MPTGELQIMARYARLKELGFDTDDSELFEVGELDVDFIDKLTEGDAVPVPGDSAEAEQAQQQKSTRDHLYTVPSTELATEIFSQLQNSKRYGLAQQQQQKLQEQHNIENGNPNVCPHHPATQPTAVAICSHSSTATGASLQEQQPQGGGIGRGGASHSGRWVGRKIEERSGKCRTMGCESYHRDNSSSVLDGVNINSSAPSSRPTCGQWTPSIQRVASHRDGEQPALDHHSQEPVSSRVGTQPQHQEKQSRTLHSSRIDIRNSQRTQRSSKESSLRESQFNAPIPGPEKRSLPSVMHPRSDASSCGSVTEERDPIFQRSSSAKEAASGLQRSSSTVQRSETSSTENWRDHPASKSAHVSDRTKHRVSFSLTEDHEVETQKLREKFREPIAQCKKVLQAKQQQQQTTTNKQPLRYNYEQPGFVEREKENICAGKAYTIYGVKDAKDCPKGPSGRHHQLVRAFSLREKNGSNYTKMPRAYSVNAGGGRHLMPMECDSCGKGGIGIVFLGLPGDDANSCKACGCGESKPPKKKKSIMDYCRKILRLTPKPR